MSPKRGKLVLIVGPSGVGKGTLVDLLRARCPQFYFPPSVTTRPPRAGEVDGQVYHFIADGAFEELRAADELLEWAVVHATRKYATLKTPILEAIAAGRVVIREVDIQGLISIRARMPATDLVSIFIAPPDLETIRRRILRRQPTIDAGELANRLASAAKELAQKTLADFEVVSREGQLEELVQEVLAIIAKTSVGINK